MSFSKLNFFFGDIMTKREQAMQNFKNGYNCAQAVLLAFSDELEIDEKRLLSYRRRSAAAWEECAKSAARSAVCLWSRGLNTVTPILRQTGKGGTLRACPETCGRFQEKTEALSARNFWAFRTLPPRPNRAPPLIIKSALVSNLSATRRNFLKICPENK